MKRIQFSMGTVAWLVFAMALGVALTGCPVDEDGQIIEEGEDVYEGEPEGEPEPEPEPEGESAEGEGESPEGEPEPEPEGEHQGEGEVEVEGEGESLEGEVEGEVSTEGEGVTFVNSVIYFPERRYRLTEPVRGEETHKIYVNLDKAVDTEVYTKFFFRQDTALPGVNFRADYNIDGVDYNALDEHNRENLPYIKFAPGETETFIPITLIHEGIPDGEFKIFVIYFDTSSGFANANFNYDSNVGIMIRPNETANKGELERDYHNVSELDELVRSDLGRSGCAGCRGSRKGSVTLFQKGLDAVREYVGF